MTRDRLLVIGAGIGQVPLVEHAKSRGIHVTVVSRPGDYPCFSLADEVCLLDIYDYDAIVEFAKRQGITAVASDQNDLMMPTVAYVAERCGLPGNGYERILDYCNKNRFRSLCERAGTPVPRHVRLTSAEIPAEFSTVPLPWIVKPEDSQSSIGVKKISSLEEFAPAVQPAIKASHSGGAVLEEFFSGREVVCEGLVCNGQYYNLSLGDRRYFDLPNLLIPSQTLFPSLLPQDIQNRIMEHERRNTLSGGLNFAILHSEYLVNLESGEIRIVETAPRGGGVYISSHLIPAATGIDITDLVLSFAMGEQPDVSAAFSSKVDRASAYLCFCLPEGVIQSVEGEEELRARKGVLGVFLDGVRVGAKTGPMLYKGARKGPILIEGENREELEQIAAWVRSNYKVSVAQGDGQVLPMRWS